MVLCSHLIFAGIVTESIGVPQGEATAAGMNKSPKDGPARKWTSEVMTEALHALKTCEITTISEAERRFAIPKTTLQRYCDEEGIIPNKLI